MHNSYLIVGPPADPAKIKGMTSAAGRVHGDRRDGSTFVSRGDESGTHTKELGYWKKAGITPEGAWYIETGQGMGATLQVASEKAGYTLTDIATWLATRSSSTSRASSRTIRRCSTRTTSSRSTPRSSRR